MEDKKLISLKNNNGSEVVISNFGGIIKDFIVDGTNIVRTKDTIEDYKDGDAYMGALIGRVGNRIGKGTFRIEDQEYHIPINNGPNTNHGGEIGFDSRIWNVKEVGENKLVLSLLSEDGDQGFPGNLNVLATFTLTDEDELIIDFKANTDQVTPVNLTSHSYFNLNGSGDIKDHLLKVNSNLITSSDENLLPTGVIEDISDTALDFTEFKRVNEALVQTDNINIKNAKGVDHNFIFKETPDNELIEMAEIQGDKLFMKVLSDQPGLQVYSGNYLNEAGPNGIHYNNYEGIAFEPQNWPDAVNHENFPNSLLKPGEKYQARIIYKVGKK